MWLWDNLGTHGPPPPPPHTSFYLLRSWLWSWDLLLPSTISSSNLLPPPSYSSQLLHPPPKPPPNSSDLLQKGLKWLISSYMKRFQCYSAQKSLLCGCGGGIAIIATSSRSRSLRDLRQTLDLDPSLTIFLFLNLPCLDVQQRFVSSSTSWYYQQS